MNDQAQVLNFLAQASSYPHAVENITHIETHISHLFLTGSFVYKLKKAVAFSFLDFSTVEKRRFFCERELELNRRFSPALYDCVLSICTKDGQICFGPREYEIEPVLRMKQFDNGKLFANLADRHELTAEMLLGITDTIAAFHAIAESKPQFGSVNSLRSAIADNFEVYHRPAFRSLREQLEMETAAQAERIERRRATHVRLLHGDLHLRNMCIFEGSPCLFDGIEFSEEFACCDTWSDFAFFIMDLRKRHLYTEASLVTSRYLETTDDFDGVFLLPLFVSYRATVRAKIAWLSLAPDASRALHTQTMEEIHGYLSLARSALQRQTPHLIAVGGISGSGKSTLAQSLSAELGGIQIRSDAIRKHLHKVALLTKAPADTYSESASRRTYSELSDRAQALLRAGITVVVDAVFLDQQKREAIEDLARRERVSFYGLWCETTPEIARSRVRSRTGDISDATVELLTAQQTRDPGKMTWTRLNTSATLSEVQASALSLLRTQLK